ncbi:hypothetical protein WL88_10710 [Burkholderia diffusa]|uniref:DUF2933 domain-containing protein n=1 Tax=Burkholderia diffusa TaxID=488732 RepID=A0AAW3PKL1_9BURK|nr:DUF2933 domain-containing protein [Burkholderia diffusa]KWF26705.1 hypothetical protein WL85_02330 [Burkholderia diffusa]KWF31704.1 hypothetical protein WL86_02125 [Burkholderia diffusa]KWF39476.1 hypothetical protein WL87_07220 [Burkholderia diffusa]KWF57306.1 hypothetical protein WL88_10710 [Burkholderia diffusa]
MEHGNPNRKAGSFGLSRANMVLIAFIAIGGFYLATEHRAHPLGWLPFLFILACPLMHLFMHHGHGGDRSDAPPDADTNEPDRNREPPPHHH